MIVRTYGRRSRGIPTLDDVVGDGFAEPLSQETPPDIYDFGFSSQDSSRWSFDSDPFGASQGPLPDIGRRGGEEADVRKPKKARNGRKNCGIPVAGKSAAVMGPTATLMETQEYGEMMEHVDEVNFALDGLRKGQPVRIRRASLLSLLSICATAQQRRLLRTHGMAKTIIDAILGLNFDDSPSNLAAAALFYILTSDGQDDHLLESPGCIRFLLKLLKPIISESCNDKAPSIGLKLLALRKDTDSLQDKMKSLDSSSAAIALKVQEVLLKCKELKSCDRNDNGMGRPELSPKWIALLTMEKASLTTISLEETTGTVRKTGGNFKEKLRELEGLDAIFDVALNCHSIFEGRLGPHAPLNSTTKDNANPESLALLLKSLKIMENATFLSKENQCHLLGMRANVDCQKSSLSFTELVISLIKILSGFFLNKSFAVSNEEESYNLSDGTAHANDMLALTVKNRDGSASTSKCFDMERTSSEKSFSICGNSQRLSILRLRSSASSSEASASSLVDTCLLKTRVDSSTSGSCSVASKSSSSERHAICGLRKNSVLGKRSTIPNSEDAEIIPLEDSEDPFAFDEDDYEPSKWEMLYGKPKASRSRKSRVIYKELENGFESQLMLSQEESSTDENHHSHEITCSDAIDEENLTLLSDCLLTAVKVLMNLTNDNLVGCQQIAACGGLETMSSLIACHFPLFHASSSSFRKMPEDNSLSQSTIELDHQKDGHLTEQQLDFLVAILGLLVNLVEKDSHNRSRLAAASVLFPGSEGVNGESRKDVIPLLCSIFLANRGAGEAAPDEGNHSPENEEAALLLGEKEAEQTIIEAYAALLLAFLSTESKSTRNAIADHLPEHNVAILVPVLERFLAFHLTLDMISPETHVAVTEVIESCRRP